MPFVNGLYQLLPGVYGVFDQPIDETDYNAQIDDFAAAFNSVRTIASGGTGASTKQGAINSIFSGAEYIKDNAFLLADPADVTKLFRIDVGAVAGGTTRVLSMPDADVSISGYMGGLLNTASSFALQTALGITPVPVIKNVVGAVNAVKADNGAFWRITGTTTSVTLAAAATLGAGWTILLRNDSPSSIPIDPNGAETIDGAATLTLIKNASVLITCDGTAFETMFLNQAVVDAAIAALKAGANTWSGQQSFFTAGTPVLVNSNDGTEAKIRLSDIGVVRGYIGSNAAGVGIYNHLGALLAQFLNTGSFFQMGTFSSTGASDGFRVSAAGQANFSATSVGTVTRATFTNPNNTVGSISTTGSATTYATTSDERLKENFQSFDSGALIDALNAYHFDWKVGGTGYGVKAQQTYAIFPDAVAVGTGEPGDEEFMPWGIDYSKFVPILLAEVKALRARVATLEA
ncbi:MULTISPECIES: tail fiber domain-containing protein [unclassified Mesorhizobium]|uniref:tail fiber domain-containing protein n=1 Tax=unclassified Mesorhizobium TaxID=325217 RepID=UPI001126BAF0|nr:MULTISPECIES: tail fiber domain-containing protein [unclassified Mesorhizobium]TPJ38193.1 tail fiber domain-containing protein [Mesorhizobium sp. B2-6-6]MCA0000966.1 tail fiber domain-containing protein [Mesorhizobium sp. B264B2A]MCA0004715.1 tail fiber domain-containing protein [Mesorhizobium sp. B264B1B]MCA0019086.1 tail fiber domain-containing protein [Mesorhizobium sp. B264B1A]TPJ56611.1 tail fiber domain-containing protein [Mesorhizobium sp. B2-6-7]